MNLNLTKALALAAALGYAGGADAAAVAKFLREYAGEVKDAKGNAIDLKSIVVVPETKTIGLDLGATDAPKADEAKSNATIDNILKKLTEIESKGVKSGGPSIEVSGGMTVEQKAYANRAKDGKTAFKTVEEAMQASDYLLGHVLPSHPQLDSIPSIQTARKAWNDRLSSGNFVAKDLTLLPGSGAVLAGMQFANDILRLVDQYGVVTQFAKVIDGISGEHIHYKRSPGSMRAKYDGSSTSQDSTFSQVKLIPKQGTIFSIVSRELLAASPLAVVDTVTQDLAWALAKEADQVGFNGAGLPADGNIIGAAGAFATDGLTVSTAAAGVNTDLAGANSAGQWSGYAIGHFHKLIGLLRAYAWQLDGGDVAWYCTQAFYQQVMVPLAITSTRANATEVFAGPAGTPTFLGYPVRFVEAMNRTASTGTTTIDCYFGNLKTAMFYGRGRLMGGGSGIEIASSEFPSWSANAINVRAVIRHDVNVHDRGDTTTAGALGYLYQV